MSKKKMTRLGLNELAKVMPVLTEEEAAALVGGDRYYDSGGMFLGEYGEGSAIRIVDSSAYRSFISTISDPECLESDYAMYQKQLNTGSSSLSGASLETKYNIVSDIVNSVKGDSGNVVVVLDSNRANNTGWYDNSSDTIHINAASALYNSASNHIDIELTFLHEATHVANRNMPSVTDKDKALIELKSYKAVMDSPKFNSASPTYRAKVQEQYNYFLDVYNGKRPFNPQP